MSDGWVMHPESVRVVESLIDRYAAAAICVCGISLEELKRARPRDPLSRARRRAFAYLTLCHACIPTRRLVSLSRGLSIDQSTLHHWRKEIPFDRSGVVPMQRDLVWEYFTELYRPRLLPKDDLGLVIGVVQSPVFVEKWGGGVGAEERAA